MLNGNKSLIEGYTGQVELAGLLFLLFRIALALYLLASALAEFDRHKLARWEVIARVIVPLLILWKTPLVMFVGIGLAVILIVWHYLGTKIMMKPPSLELACTLTVELADIRELGEGRAGKRRIIPIIGGTVTGPKLSGKYSEPGRGLADSFCKRRCRT